jgi:hypothetical protein
MRGALRVVFGIVALGWLAGPSPAAPPGRARVVQVRASPAFAGCAAVVADAFTRRHGVLVQVETGDPASVGGADVVLGDDAELIRTLEGGLADVRTAVDLGYVPWVLVTPEGDPSAPRSLADLDRTLTGPLHVLEGPAGREAREALHLDGDRVSLSADPRVLRAARTAVLPATLAGAGSRRPVAVRPLVAVAAAVGQGTAPAETRLLLEYLATADARHTFDRCAGSSGPAPPPPPAARGAAAAGFARGIEDSWLPRCSLTRNLYSEPGEVLGPPDAVPLGNDRYRGLMSLGQGGYVVIDMGRVVDGPGPDIRVYQTTAGEPVTVYASDSPSAGFTLVGLQRYCGNRSGGGVRSNHCDFDLGEAGMSGARYLKIEDGEIYPCVSAGTFTEGADIDAVESLHR